jgi:Electron transfer DM13
MTIHPITWLLRRKWILVAVGLPVLVALWWAFRPEKLWINQKVNEPAPFDETSGPQPILTGRFESKSQQISGRATIYKKPGGEEYLRLSDFTAPNDSDIHVVLGRGDDQELTRVLKGGPDSIDDSVDLGSLKTNQGDQNYDIPAATDLNKYDAVLIFGERSHMIFGLANLEPF